MQFYIYVQFVMLAWLIPRNEAGRYNAPLRFYLKDIILKKEFQSLMHTFVHVVL